MKSSNVFRLSILILGASLFARPLAARAADKDDIYFEGFGGLDIDKTHRLLFGSTVGYCPWDEIGLGVTFEQALGSKTSDNFDQSLRGAVEFRWFLEPWEFWIDTGYLVTHVKEGSGTKSGTINLGGAYLFSITPSMAIRLGAHVQFPYTAIGTIFTTAALRILW